MKKDFEECKNCIYFFEDKGVSNFAKNEEGTTYISEKNGECHRKPPLIEGWPRVKGNDWCGEARNSTDKQLIMKAITNTATSLEKKEE